MDARVPATVALLLAKAELKVAELERQESSTPMITRNSDARIAIGRRLRVARELADSWWHVVTLIELDGAEESSEESEKAAPAPERIVAWTRYQEDRNNDLVCNRLPCKESGKYSPAGWVAMRASDLTQGVCDVCGNDVLA